MFGKSDSDQIIDFVKTNSATLQQVDGIQKGHIRVNVWLGDKNNLSVGHGSIQAFRFNATKNEIEEAYIGFWPLNEKELEESNYGAGIFGSLKYWKSLVFGIAGKFVTMSTETVGEAGYPTVWEVDHDRFVKRLGALPTYSYKFITLDVDKAFAEITRLKDLASKKPDAFCYSPRAICLLGTDNCLSIVERVLHAAGFEEKLSQQRYDIVSLLGGAVVGAVGTYRNTDFLSLGARMAKSVSPSFVLNLVPAFCHNLLRDYQKQAPLIAVANVYLAWACFRFVSGATIGWRNSYDSCRNQQAPQNTTGKMLARSASALFGGVSYLSQLTQLLLHPPVYAVKTPENFVEILQQAQRVEFTQYPILKTYDILCQGLINVLPATQNVSKYILDTFSYHYLLRHFNPGKLTAAQQKAKFDAENIDFDSFDDQLLTDIDRDYYKQHKTLLTERAKKLSADLSTANASETPRIQNNLAEVNKEITAIDTKYPGL
jgi:hypothetical protein